LNDSNRVYNGNMLKCYKMTVAAAADYLVIREVFSTVKCKCNEPANGKKYYSETRLNPFARSWFYNATAVRGALWWLRQSHSVNYAIINIRQAAARRWKLHFLRYRLDKVSWKSVQPFPRTVVCFFDGRKKKTKKTKKICKTYTLPPHWRLRKIAFASGWRCENTGTYLGLITHFSQQTNNAVLFNAMCTHVCYFMYYVFLLSLVVLNYIVICHVDNKVKSGKNTRPVSFFVFLCF